MFKLLALITLTLGLTGCRMIQYTSPEGATLYMGNVGYATEIGALDVQKGDTHVKVEGYKSDATKALDLANKVIDRVP